MVLAYPDNPTSEPRHGEAGFAPRLLLIGEPGDQPLLDEVVQSLCGEADCEVVWHDGVLPALPEAHLALLVMPAAAVSAGERLVEAVCGRCSTVVICGEHEIESLARSGGERVVDFVVHPASLPEVILRVRRALGACVRQASVARPAPVTRWAARGIIGSNRAYLAELGKLEKIAACDATVLIRGETGTGKEVFAQAIHYASARAGNALVAINCGAIPAELVEDELFGHVKGAYTTALGARDGLVREAEGGTLFLDDIDCLPLPAQAKLLRFLQEREYRPVGSNTVHRANVRVIAASNRDLQAWCGAGRFREDLFFRINVLSLRIPSLRDRRDDIAALAQHFIAHVGKGKAQPVTELSPAALQKLVMYDWPGNVRELKSVIERSVLLARGRRLEAHEIELSEHCVPSAAVESFHAMKAQVIENFERSYIERLLISTRGNVSAAANLAQKNRRAFFELIRKHGIAADSYRARA